MTSTGGAPRPDVDNVVERIRAVYQGWGRKTPVAQMRRDWDVLFGREILGARNDAATINGVDTAWICAPGVHSESVVVYFHGGGFQVGSLLSHRELMVGISAAAGCRVLGVDYRLAPEHHFPAPLQDALAVFDGLLAQGMRADQIALASDSAGGAVALWLLLALRDAGRLLPRAAVLMSPWTDLSASGSSYETRAGADPIHQRPMIQALARNFLGSGPDACDPGSPAVSPLFASLHGLPPFLIQVGDRETVLSDSTELAKKAQAAQVPVTLEVWPEMVHVFQQFPHELHEARAAIASAGQFLRQHLPTPNP